MSTTEPPAHLIKTGALGLRGSRVFAATAAFEVPWDSYQECAEELSRAVLLAVADDLRAEGAREALTGLAEEHALDAQAEEIGVVAQAHRASSEYARAYRDDHYPATESTR